MTGQPGAVEAVRPYRVVKMPYAASAKPWRVVDANGAQLVEWAGMDHPLLGPTSFIRPVAFQRKRDAVAWLAANPPLDSNTTGV